MKLKKICSVASAFLIATTFVNGSLVKDQYISYGMEAINGDGKKTEVKSPQLVTPSRYDKYVRVVIDKEQDVDGAEIGFYAFYTWNHIRKINGEWKEIKKEKDNTWSLLERKDKTEPEHSLIKVINHQDNTEILFDYIADTEGKEYFKRSNTEDTYIVNYKDKNGNKSEDVQKSFTNSLNNVITLKGIDIAVKNKKVLTEKEIIEIKDKLRLVNKDESITSIEVNSDLTKEDGIVFKFKDESFEINPSSIMDKIIDESSGKNVEPVYEELDLVETSVDLEREIESNTSEPTLSNTSSLSNTEVNNGKDSSKEGDLIDYIVTIPKAVSEVVRIDSETGKEINMDTGKKSNTEEGKNSTPSVVTVPKPESVDKDVKKENDSKIVSVAETTIAANPILPENSPKLVIKVSDFPKTGVSKPSSGKVSIENTPKSSSTKTEILTSSPVSNSNVDNDNGKNYIDNDNGKTYNLENETEKKEESSITVRKEGKFEAKKNGLKGEKVSVYNVNVKNIENKINNITINNKYEFNHIENTIKGGDSIELSINASKFLYKNGSSNVIVVNKGKLSDVLTAIPYATRNSSPILYTDGNSLNIGVVEEIQRLGSKNITIIGGEKSVSKEISHVLNRAGYFVNRIGGRDRYETNRLLNQGMNNARNQVAVVSGEDFPDALAVSSYVVKNDMILVLVKKNSIPNYAKTLISKIKNAKVKIFGGDKSVSNSLAEELANNNVIVDRLFGNDRYETSEKISDQLGYGNGVVISNGDDAEKTLIASLISSKMDRPLTLVKNTKESKKNLNKKINTVKKIIVE